MTRPARIRIVIILVIAAAIAAAVWLLNRRPAPVITVTPNVAPVTARKSVEATLPAVRFTDITANAGIDFVHDNGADGRKLLPETMGSGCAFFDFDADGDPDILLANGNGALKAKPPEKDTSTPRLYRNAGGRFTDVTAEMGLNSSLYGMGVTAGDIDNDGYPEVFLTGVGRKLLLHNEAGRRFNDITQTAGVAGEGGWTTGATFLDYNNDGSLDLWVCHYVHWTADIDLAQDFQIAGIGRAYGPPMNFAGAYCALYRGDGRGKFIDVSEQAGIRVKNPVNGEGMGKSLAALTCDFDRDGWTDVFVANDTVRNFLFRNKGDGAFEEIGERSGVARDENGLARGAMGTDAADYRNDGLTAIAVANFTNEMNALYTPLDTGDLLGFTDAALAEGIGAPSRRLLKFGLFFFDYDLDGRQDLLTANGNLEPDIEKVQASQTFAQPAQLFWNCGEGARASFAEIGPAQAGSDLFKPIVGRGSAYADIDGDGDLDVLMTGNNGPAILLRNDALSGEQRAGEAIEPAWLRIQLVGKTCNRDAIGARLELHAGGTVQRREVRAARSYLSQSELVQTFGLGTINNVDKLIVHWPGGGESTHADLTINTRHVIEQPGAAGKVALR